MSDGQTPGPTDERSEPPIRTPDDLLDEDLDLRADTEEWREYPSPEADPASPESVAERMAGPDGRSAG